MRLVRKRGEAEAPQQGELVGRTRTVMTRRIPPLQRKIVLSDEIVRRTLGSGCRTPLRLRFLRNRSSPDVLLHRGHERGSHLCVRGVVQL